MAGSELLADKVAVVTGGGGAIGRALASAMAAAGAVVVVNDIGASLAGGDADEGPARRTAAAITAAGGRAIASTVSITDPNGATAIVREAIDAFGRVDIVVNNAGIIRDAMFHKMSAVDFDAVLDVHLRGSFHMSRAAAALFREQGGGVFLHMTSTSALIGQVGQANYMAAKMGIVGLSRAIALDMARFGVRSNCISPFAWSRMTSSLPTDTEAQRARVAKFQAMGPETIAPLAVWLASDAARDVSGQIFAVRNNEIFVMSQPRPLRSVHRSDGWTSESVGEVALPALKASLVPLEVSGDVFTWDPI